MKAPKPGTTVDERFLLEEEVGKGHGATMFRAQDVLLKRHVSLRWLSDSVFQQGVRSHNLLQLQRSRAFVHQNVVTIHDVVCKADLAYLVTDWVDGESLNGHIEANGPMRIQQITRFMGDLRDALDWVHQIAECGRLHPGNLVVSDAGLIVTEPYYLRVADAHDSPWDAFLAPEQKEASWTGGAGADIFAAAMIAGYLLLGRVPTPGVALSKDSERSSPPLDAAFVVATQENPTLRATTLTQLLNAIQELEKEPNAEANQDGDTVEFRSVFAGGKGSGVDNPTGAPALDFTEPEGLEAREPELQESVDSRLHGEPVRRRQDTIELDLNDAAVMIVQDATLNGDGVSHQAPIAYDTIEEKIPGFNADVPAPVELEPTVSAQGNDSNETDNFQMVPDKAIFGESALPSRTIARDEYDTLEAESGRHVPSDSSRPFVSPETQAFQRPDVVGKATSKEERGSMGTVTILLLILAAGIAIYAGLEKKQKPANGRMERPERASQARQTNQIPKPTGQDVDAQRTADSEVPAGPNDTSNGELGDVNQAAKSDASVEPSQPDASIRVDGASEESSDSQNSLNDGGQVESSDTADPKSRQTDANEGAVELPPATDRKQFTCNAFDMALVTKRGSLKQEDGTSLRIIAKAYCVDKYEYPGKGATPHTNVSLSQAKQGCKARGRRLCTASEWRGACGGRYPYRGPYEPGRCNAMVEVGNARPIAAAGTFSRCKSGWGTYDMVGNVAEWTSAGNIHGGSYQLDGEEANCNRKRTRLDPSPKVGYRCCADAKRKDLQ